MTRLTQEQIAALEEQMGVRLPQLYRELLHDFGHGVYGTREIYHPEMVEELYEPFFEDAELLFAPFFPCGCDNETQEIWVIDAGRELAASISHETHPDDWAEESWLPYGEWKAAAPLPGP